jgi:hypothetical protein
MVKSLAVLKAAFVAKQLENGISFDQLSTTIQRKDLYLLATNFIYGSPSRIQNKKLPVDVLGFWNDTPSDPALKISEPKNLSTTWDPFQNVLKVVHKVNDAEMLLQLDRSTGKFTVLRDNSEGKLTVDTAKLPEKLLKLEKDNNIDFNVVEFEMDDLLAQLLAKQTLPRRTRTELTSIQEDAQFFTSILNAQLSKPPKTMVDSSTNRKAQFAKISEEAKRIRAEIKKNKANPNALYYTYYNANVKAYNELVAKFPDLTHYTKSILVGLATGSHVYAFGPPGGAKTMISRLILEAEISAVNRGDWSNFYSKFFQTVNKKDPKALGKLMQAIRAQNPRNFEIFFLQFHKLLPEGKIIGFPKLQSQIDHGRVEYNFEDSLAAKKFLFAILDEVDKANPAVLTSLLSMLNEREIFAGAEVFKAALQTAILTSNKMPSEQRESFGDDKAAADALLDRMINKAYVSNKFTEREQLAQMLSDVNDGLPLKLETPLNMTIVKSLIPKVDFRDENGDPADIVPQVFAKIFEKYHAARLKVKEDSEDAHQADPATYPDYYLPASSASNRTQIALLNQLKARVLVEQIISGVPYEKLRYDVHLEDLVYAFEGLGYWSPAKITSYYTSNGLLQLDAKTDALEKLIGSPNISLRQKAMLREILGEVKDFVSAANDVINTYVVEYRDTIAQYKYLFPTLFGSKEKLDAWIAAHPPKAK